MIKVIYVLVSFYFAKTLCKNVISISIDKENKHKDSKEDSEEKNHNNINIEIHNSINKTHENGIPISSFSGSVETYNADKELQSNVNEARKFYYKEEMKQQKTEPGNDNVYFQNIPNSFEENKSLKVALKNNLAKQSGQRSGSNRDSKFSEKMQMEPQPHESDEINFNIMPKGNIENMKAELSSDCGHYNKIRNEYKNTKSMRAASQRGKHFTDKKNRYDKHSVKNPPESQKDDLGHEKVLSEIKMRANTKPYIAVENYSDKISKTYSNSVNVWEKHSNNDKVSKRFKNTESTEQHSENSYKEKLSDSFENLVHTRVQTRSDNYQKPSSINQNTGNTQIKPEKNKIFHKIATDLYSAENIGTIDDAASEKKCNQEKISSLFDDVEIKNEYQGLAIAIRNSTIEASDRGYQESMHTQESDDEDQSSLADYPYSVSIQRKGAHYASGALVGAVWVLSTAEEFFNVRETIKLFRLRVGTLDCKKGGVVIPLKTLTIHPSFVPGQPSFDISILRVAEQVPLSSLIKPIGLSRVAGKVKSTKFLTTYWPRIVGKQGVVPLAAKERVKYSSMRVSTQKMIPSDECAKLLAAVNVTLDKNSLCLKPVRAHHSDCMPDIGAPVVAVDGLWGITSGWVSTLCPHKPIPTLFTRVSTSELRTWINTKMQE